MRIKNRLLPSATILAFIACSGCSTILNGTTQSLSVQTIPESGANCSLANDHGKWFVNSTPGSVVVHRSNRPLNVECQKEGYQPTTQVVLAHGKGAVAGNLIAGGFVGAGVDLADGAAFKYPNLVTVPMKKTAMTTTSHRKHHHKKSH